MILTQLTGWTFKVELPSEHSMLLFKGNNSYLRVECRPEVFFYVALYQQFHSLNNLISAHSHLLKLKKSDVLSRQT